MNMKLTWGLLVAVLLPAAQAYAGDKLILTTDKPVYKTNDVVTIQLWNWTDSPHTLKEMQELKWRQVGDANWSPNLWSNVAPVPIAKRARYDLFSLSLPNGVYEIRTKYNLVRSSSWISRTMSFLVTQNGKVNDGKLIPITSKSKSRLVKSISSSTVDLEVSNTLEAGFEMDLKQILGGRADQFDFWSVDSSGRILTVKDTFASAQGFDLFNLSLAVGASYDVNLIKDGSTRARQNP